MKITDVEINESNVKSAPDVLNADGEKSTRDIKDIFDRLPELIAKKHNELVDYLQKDGTPVKAEDIAFIRLNADGQIEVSKNGTDWTATASSGHLVIDKNGNQLPQRTRLKFANSAVTDNGTETVVEGMPGPKGDKGDTGPIGPQGIQGKIAVPTVNNSGDLEWAFVETNEAELPAPRNIKGPAGVQGIQGPRGNVGPAGQQGVQGIQGIQGPQGLKGDAGADGKSFVIKSIYASLSALEAAHPIGNEGDAYAIGTETGNTIYLWDVDKGKWTNIGPMRGPQGPQGIQGVAGVQGETGPAGPQGIQGEQGVPGIQGPQGLRGPQGNPTTVNGKSGTSITLNAYDVGALPITGGTINGNLQLNPGGNSLEGGQIDLYAASDSCAGSGIDNYNSMIRIYGIASKDGTSKKGAGSILEIDPYAKTITGGYTITGTLNGNATSATKATTDANGNNIADTYATKEEIIPPGIDWFAAGKSIPSGADLDTYTTVGMYYAANGTTASSLVNCPTKANFKMYVFTRTTNKSVNQLLLCDDAIYIRGANSSGNFCEWSTFLSDKNKPSGTYTGDGQSATRTISIGGDGNVLAIYSGKGTAFVTKKGAMYYNVSSNTVKGFSTSQGFVEGGKLYLATADETVNANGTTYEYQVL